MVSFVFASMEQIWQNPAVSNNTIRWIQAPAYQVKVDSRFKYVGSVSFRIRDVAEGCRLVFVDGEDRTVKRLFIVQCESILPSSTATYKYRLKDEIGGERFLCYAFAYSNAITALDNPNDEAAVTANFLRGLGIDIPDLLIGSRFATIPDLAKKHELILFYFEPVPAGLGLGDLYSGEISTAKMHDLSPEYLARGRAVFSISPRPPGE